jgi:SAM-dependent methyltransferase
MGTRADNELTWNQPGVWGRGGEQWSWTWGGSANQWYGAVLPRIHHYLPATLTVEIGPGFGRWTQYLKDWTRRLVVVDLSETCIRACRQRFEGVPHVEAYLTDGRSLDVVEAGSVDFVFSLDSLVHADLDTMTAYLRALGRVLAPDGVAFLHHSNLAAHRTRLALARRASRPLRALTARSTRAASLLGRIPPLSTLRYLENHWRSPDVSAALVAAACGEHGLVCRSQELVTWGDHRLLRDAFSVVTRRGSRWDRPAARAVNRDFMREARRIAALGSLYGSGERNE